MSGGHNFTSISAGDGHTCGITEGGKAYCWGLGTYGLLGNGSTGGSPVPVAVSGGHTFTSISAGLSLTCGITTDKKTYCWGKNQKGELGNGSTGDSSVPVAVSGGLTFTSISAGHYHTCGIAEGGEAYCWGYRWSGALGDGIDSGFSAVPVAVSGGHTFTSISVSQYHTCGIATGGQAYCWGGGQKGELGNGSTGNSSVPVAVSGGLTFTSISAGHYYHTCGIAEGGKAYCWGEREGGKLGDGIDSGFSEVPVAVSGGHTFTSISASSYYTCGIAEGGKAYCWGENNFFSGGLGDGSSISSLVPIKVKGKRALKRK
ncbi:regulator of chromosome condensation, RCC1 [Bdellovibrio bacteriovorus W]|nr:regulator of chromosome condensation, RCC1 [Bdellovibrio bacteriovorus W]